MVSLPLGHTQRALAPPISHGHRHTRHGVDGCPIGPARCVPSKSWKGDPRRAVVWGSFAFLTSCIRGLDTATVSGSPAPRSDLKCPSRLAPYHCAGLRAIHVAPRAGPLSRLPTHTFTHWFGRRLRDGACRWQVGPRAPAGGLRGAGAGGRLVLPPRAYAQRHDRGSWPIIPAQPHTQPPLVLCRVEVMAPLSSSRLSPPHCSPLFYPAERGCRFLQALAAMPAAAALAADDAGVASSRMSYSRFLVRPSAPTSS